MRRVHKTISCTTSTSHHTTPTTTQFFPTPTATKPFAPPAVHTSEAGDDRRHGRGARGAGARRRRRLRSRRGRFGGRPRPFAGDGGVNVTLADLSNWPLIVASVGA
eukprot:6749453-Prymnesium_polylepis.1